MLDCSAAGRINARMGNADPTIIEPLTFRATVTRKHVNCQFTGFPTPSYDGIGTRVDGTHSCTRRRGQAVTGPFAAVRMR